MKPIKRLTLCALFALCSLYAYAYDFTAKNDDGKTIYYNIVSSSKRTCEVSHPNYFGSYSGSLTIPEMVTYSGRTYTVVGIGMWAFCYCPELTIVEMPNTITYIDEVAFQECYGLISVTISNSVTEIGQQAFWYCESLTSIFLLNPEPPECGSGVFSNVDIEACTLYVPIGSYEAYSTTRVWENFNIVGIDFTNEGFYEKFVDDVEDLEALLQEIWDVITSEYSDVSKEFKDEYDSLVDELDKLLENIMDAYRNGNIMDRKYEFMEKIEELKQKIEALLATAKEAHETSAGIDNINIDPSEVEGIYTISGLRVNTVQRGVNILRYSDGTTKKVMVKSNNN